MNNWPEDKHVAIFNPYRELRLDELVESAKATLFVLSLLLLILLFLLSELLSNNRATLELLPLRRRRWSPSYCNK